MLHVLFVDDDQTLLSGLRRMLHSMRSEWDMRFVADSTTVLDLFNEWRPDVIVSDMRMPVMDGATLLTKIRAQHPGIVRIILSGHTEMASALKSVPVAHRFLNKPCDPGSLKAAIDSSFQLQRRLDNPILRDMLCGVAALPSPSEVVSALNEALANSDTSLQEVEAIVSRDVALSAKILQLSNSAFFGLAREVTSVAEAMSSLGLGTIRDLAATADVYRLFESVEKSGLVDFEWFEAHSRSVANTARSLILSPRESQEAFSAGLLHDVGLLAIAANMPDEFQKLQERLATTSSPIDVVEREIWSATHAELGAYLLTLWGLPYAIVEPVARHHDSDLSLEGELTPIHSVRLAEVMCTVKAPGWEGRLEGFDTAMIQGFDPATQQRIIEAAL